MKTIVTTAGRPDEVSRQLAKEASNALGYKLIDRKKRSIKKMQQQYESAVLVAGNDRFELYRPGMEKPFSFIPIRQLFV